MTNETTPTLPTMTAADAEQHVMALEKTVSQIITMLGKETEAVKAIDLPAFIALQDEKAIVIDDYQQRLRKLLLHKDLVRSLPLHVKDRVRELEQSLAIARVENMARLERAGKSFARLRDRIVDVARATALRTSSSYGPTGLMNMSARKTISTGLHDQA